MKVASALHVCATAARAARPAGQLASAGAASAARASMLGIAAALAGAWLGAACGGEKERFEIVFDDLEASLFSVWGRSADDMWVVGADPGDGPLVLHYDGDAWTRRDTGASGDLWWIFGGENEVWMSGEGGLIIRYDEGDDAFEVMEAPEAEDDLTLFGIFPVSETDVWAVGGTREDGREGRVYRYDGSAWAPAEGIPEAATDDPLFKVWGRGADDIWIVGLGDTAFHWDGEAWTEMDTTRRLLTIHGNDEEVVAVGGFQDAYLVGARGEGALAELATPRIEAMIGVWVEPGGDVLTAGIEAAMWERLEGEWSRVPDLPAPPLGTAYHGVFVDDEGGAWAVGGEVEAPPFDNGVLSHRGGAVSSEIR